MKENNIYGRARSYRRVVTMLFGAAFFTLHSSLFTSCTDYLDKTPDSDVNPEMAFMNFTNFQGFVEEVYNCIPNKESNFWCCTFNWGEDELMNTVGGDTHVTAHFDLGDYRNWYDNDQSYLHRSSGSDPSQLSPTSTNKFSHSLEHAWYCIRKMNLGLENLDKLTNATQEEKNLIKGQMLFFRAWWHQELMVWFGGMPYVDHTIAADGPFDLPRLSFKECAEKCAADLRAAADLLPNNWENTKVGKETTGKNDLRITKVCALGYLGKVLLWASSPLNNVGAQTGALKNGRTYEYDTELANYDYTNIYDHETSNKENNYSDIFRTTGQNWKMPGAKEAIMRGPMPDVNGSNWNFAKLWGPKVNNLVEHDAVIHMPTANYINYAYGMADGQPIVLADGQLNPNSGFDPTHPFKNRDPRFYHDIMFDGFKFLNTTPSNDDKPYQY